MPEPFSELTEKALTLKGELTAAKFTEREVAAMLGSFVLAHMSQLPPEFNEMLTKYNAMSNRALAQGGEDDA